MMGHHTEYSLMLFGVVLTMTPCLASTVGNSAENGQLNGNKIVYDLTAFVGGKQQNETISIPAYVYSEGNVSTFCYEENASVLTIKDVLENPSPDNWQIMNITRSFMGFGNISNLLAMSTHPLKTEAPNFANMNSSIPESLHISLYLRECKCTFSVAHMLHYFHHTINRLTEKNAFQNSPKRGIEYNDRFLECCESRYFPAIRDVDYTILKVEVSPENTSLSYENFSKMMTHLVEENQKYVRFYNPKSQLYIRLVSTNWNGTISADHFARYEALQNKYFKAWIRKKVVGDELYILTPFPENFVAENHRYLQENVTSLALSNSRHNASKNSAEILVSCASQQVYKVIFRVLKNVLLVQPSLDFLRSSQTICPSSNITTEELLKVRNISTSLLYSPYSTQHLNVNYLSRVTSSIAIHSIYFSNEDFPIESDLPQLLDLVKSGNIQIGCFVDGIILELGSRDELDEMLRTFTQNQTFSCGPHLFNASKMVVIEFRITQIDNIMKVLANLYKLKQSFEQTYLGKTLVPMLSYIDTDSSLFCGGESNFANELLDAVVSFANIHKWDKLVLHESFPGLWKDFSEQIKSLYGSDFRCFSFIYRVKTKNLVDENLPFTFPCVEWILTAKSSGINFIGNEHAGASLFVAKPSSWQGSRLTSEEFDTLLRIALARFSLVEVIAANIKDLHQVADVASGALIEDIERFRKLSQPNPPFVYVQVSLAHVGALTPDIVKSVNENNLAVHVRDWDSPNVPRMSSAVERAIGALSHFGISVGECDKMIKSTFATFTRFPLNKMVTFVVCDWAPLLPTHVNKVEMLEYLLGLYYAKYYMEKFFPILHDGSPYIEVIFRINVGGLERQCPVSVSRVYQNSYLRFLHMLNEFSVIHKIRYFVAHAFGPAESFTECHYNWWLIKNYSDLTNLSVYKSTEDEYFGRQTKLDFIPKTTPPEDSSSSDHYTVYYISAVVVLAVVVVAAFAQIVTCVRNRSLLNQVLTQREIKQFHDGVEIAGGDMEMLSKDLQDSMYMKFPKNFEVALRDIEKGELIGSGQFGLVCRGMIISKQLEIAIKIPRGDCGKEQFLSTLSELKILAYIGSHSNVVSFLGAYTKEIGKGKLYVFTELCEKGSLLGYLRELQSKRTGRVPELSIDMHRLCGFARQIACGMDYVAEKRIVHGDLATRNVLLTAEYACKIADFGLSRRLYELNEYKKTSREPLPWRWMAPESLGNMVFTSKSDVWSYGVTLWEIFSLGKVPYPGKTWSEGFVAELESGMRMGKAELATHDISMMNCWTLIPEERPTFTELEQYFAEINSYQYLEVEEL